MKKSVGMKIAVVLSLRSEKTIILLLMYRVHLTRMIKIDLEEQPLQTIVKTKAMQPMIQILMQLLNVTFV